MKWTGPLDKELAEDTREAPALFKPPTPGCPLGAHLSPAILRKQCVTGGKAAYTSNNPVLTVSSAKITKQVNEWSILKTCTNILICLMVRLVLWSRVPHSKASLSSWRSAKLPAASVQGRTVPQWPDQIGNAPSGGKQKTGRAFIGPFFSQQPHTYVF